MCMLDTEFTDLLRPELLSLALVTLDGPIEHYVELDLATDAGKGRKKKSSDFVRWNGVLDQWGLFPSAQATDWEMGRRTGDWLLGVAESCGTRVTVAFDYPVDYELMEHVIRDSGLWERVREVIRPLNIDRITGTIEGELAAEECLRELKRTRGLGRHHALADAHALRAAYLAIRDTAVRLTRFTTTPGYRKLVAAAAAGAAAKGQEGFDAEAFVREWLLTELRGGGPTPLDELATGSRERLELYVLWHSRGDFLDS